MIDSAMDEHQPTNRSKILIGAGITVGLTIAALIIRKTRLERQDALACLADMCDRISLNLEKSVRNSDGRMAS